MQQKIKTIQSPELQYYIESSNQFYQDLLGYKPEKTSLKETTNNQPVYFPRNQTAIIQKGNLLSLFHEYFGHGLYCEQALSGRRLVDLEKKLLKEEKQEFSDSRFNLKDLQKFRQQNKTFQELEIFRQENLGRYELFAIWTEYLLSKEFGLNKLFDEEYTFFNKENRNAIDSAVNFSEQYGNLATFYEFGLARIQDKKRLTKLSMDLFGKKLLNKTHLILHFGSKKPFSDIDLFMASNDIRSIYNSWLDVRSYNLNEVNDGIEVLNPMITDPIFAGDLIFGKERHIEELKRKIIAQPITEKAINFNLKEYECEKRRAKDKFLGKHLQNKNLRSSKTFLTNALALKNGDKVLTFNRLVDYAKNNFSQNEKFIELKEGIE